MKVEFHEDYNKNIWFTFASDIQYRESKRKTAIGELDPKKM